MFRNVIVQYKCTVTNSLPYTILDKLAYFSDSTHYRYITLLGQQSVCCGAF